MSCRSGKRCPGLRLGLHVAAECLYAPHVFNKAGMLAGASGFVGCGAAIAGSLWRARQAHNVTTYGSARWADTSEIKLAGLHGDKGVFLGQQDGHYLRHDGPEHVMAFAPTRSGKGVGLVVPTLLSWMGSAVIHDIKGENWQIPPSPDHHLRQGAFGESSRPRDGRPTPHTGHTQRNRQANRGCDEQCNWQSEHQQRRNAVATFEEDRFGGGAGLGCGMGGGITGA